MKTIYQVRRESISLYRPNEVSVCFETTRKAEAERWLNRAFRALKNGGFTPQWVREGYFQLLDDMDEYYICKKA